MWLGLMEEGAVARTPESVALRARTITHVQTLARQLGAATGGPLPDNVLRHLLLRQHLFVAGDTAGSDKCEASDYAGMCAAAGWPHITKAKSSYPFPRAPQAEGSMPLVNVKFLCDELQRLRGPLHEEDPLWTVFEHLWEHDIQLQVPEEGPSLEEQLAEQCPLRLD